MNTLRKTEAEATTTREQVLAAVLASDDLPSLPIVASQLVTLTSKGDTTLSEVAELVSQDIALSTKILKVSNSAFYSFPSKIGSIQQAVSILGTNAVQSLVLSFSFLTINKSGPCNKFNFNEFWEQSLESAIASRLILEKVPGANLEEIFVSGLLQNLGALILACTFPEEFGGVLDAIEDGEVSPREAEIAAFGGDHCFFGYEVAKSWNFPASILLPILHHHEPKGVSGEDKNISSTTKAIYLANILLDIFHSEKPEKSHREFEIQAKQLLGLKSEAIESILENAHVELGKGAANFGLKIEESKPVQEILQAANIRLSLLNLDYEQMNIELVAAKVALENLTSELREKNNILKNLANIDGLTGVYNNRFFQATMDKELSRSTRHSYHLSLILIDIDHFKGFNDTHGHLVGDFVLAEFSKVLTAALREYDTLARYGGEEFVVILPETDERDALIVAEKLRKAVETSPFKEGKEEYRVTASFGVSSAHPDLEETLGKTDMIKRADDALYEAKDSGRNRVAAYAPKKKWFGKK
ncbi:MAG: two-component system cell cycle response regulator [Halioglobus sp.]|jgi:diguanylate cyclase (GGDEF)-like protein